MVEVEETFFLYIVETQGVCIKESTLRAETGGWTFEQAQSKAQEIVSANPGWLAKVMKDAPQESA